MMNDTMADQFGPEVIGQLEYYVYRLIDPQNGETFYVGKGKGNRVFEHLREALQDGGEKQTPKLDRIRAIMRNGFSVQHIIHRHGLNEETAFEVEAALIDAYPGLSNRAAGLNAHDRGVMHAATIIEHYAAQFADISHPCLLINVNVSAANDDASVYEAVRGTWVIDPKRAERAEYVLAVRQGIIIGVYKAEKWVSASSGKFRGVGEDQTGRWGFIGYAAPTQIWQAYIRRRVPDSFRKRGAANPIRYIGC